MQAQANTRAPTVEAGILRVQAGGTPERVEVSVGSDAWFGWLVTARHFAFRGAWGGFTARVRQRKGAGYWYAFRRQGGDLREIYLGKGQDLTLERLDAAASKISGRDAPSLAPEHTPPPGDESEALGIANPAAPLLFETKLHVPRVRPSKLVRTHAVGRLARLTDCPLTIVSAPAGYGKTTLLAQWIAEMRLQVAWVTLDDGDNDIARFWTYVSAALDRLEPGLFDAMRPLLHVPTVRMPEVVATALVGALSEAADPTILVLDDYHDIGDENSLVHTAVTDLVEHLPPRVHLVMACSGDPPLPLPRLRAQQRVFELHAADLQFSLDEARVLLTERMRLDLSAQEVATLHSRTEGWIAGLQLAALTAPKPADMGAWVADFSGPSRHVFDYLIREVLERQPPERQAFMLAVAPLDRLTGPLCDAVTRSGNGQATLEALERANLFLVPLDDRREWYRFHHLFAGALLRRLQMTQPEEVAAVYGRASAWCEANGLWLEAIDYALEANDLDEAARLLDAHSQDMFTRDFLTLLRDRIDRLPGKLVSARPRLAMLHAYSLFVTGDYPTFQARLRRADDAFARRSSALATAERHLLRAELLALHTDDCRTLGTHLRPGDVTGAPPLPRGKPGAAPSPLGVAMGEQALMSLPPGHPFRDLVLGNLAAGYVMDGELREAGRLLDGVLRASEARGDVYYSHQAAQLAGYVRLQQGRLAEAEALCRRRSDTLERSGDLAAGGGLHAILGVISYERNDLEAAERYLSADLSPRHNPIFVLMIRPPARACVQLARGDGAGAHATIKSALAAQALAEADNRRTSPWLAHFLRAHQARLWLLDGNVQAASDWARGIQRRGTQASPGESDPPLLIGEWEQMVLARAEVAGGKARDALSLLEQLRAQAEDGGRYARLLEILVMEAIAYEEIAETPEALRALRRAVALGAPAGCVRTFVDGGPAVRRLLAALLAERRQQTPPSRQREAPVLPYIQTLLAEFGRAERAHRRAEPPSLPATSGEHSAVGALAPRLTARELQVMRLIARGASNKEIADALVIAVATVKRHVNNIFTKLGVRSRTQALVLAGDLHLFDS